MIKISKRNNALQVLLIVHYNLNMADENNKIDQEELDRLEDELLEKEARDREEKMRVEGRGVFELQRLKDKKLHSDNKNEAQK